MLRQLSQSSVTRIVGAARVNARRHWKTTKTAMVYIIYTNFFFIGGKGTR